MNTIEKIKNAFETIANSLPIDSVKFVELFNELTNCEMIYDIMPTLLKKDSISENIELRVYYAKDRVYCIENGIEIEYAVYAKVIDIFDKYRTVTTVLSYKLIDIANER
jgi:hypothetical protein